MPIMRKIVPGQPPITLPTVNRLNLSRITAEDAEHDPAPLSFAMPRRSKAVNITIACQVNDYDVNINFHGTIPQLRTVTQELNMMGILPVCKHQ